MADKEKLLEQKKISGEGLICAADDLFTRIGSTGEKADFRYEPYPGNFSKLYTISKPTTAEHGVMFSFNYPFHMSPSECAQAKVTYNVMPDGSIEARGYEMLDFGDNIDEDTEYFDVDPYITKVDEVMDDSSIDRLYHVLTRQDIVPGAMTKEMLERQKQFYVSLYAGLESIFPPKQSKVRKLAKRAFRR